MSDRLTLHVEGADRVFRPGHTVAGRVDWVLEKEQEAIEIRLFWYTEGRGDRDAAIAQTVRLEAPGRMGAQDFELELPAGPYTFSGRLISLVWALEAVGLPDETTTRREIVVSPDAGEVTLAPAPT